VSPRGKGILYGALVTSLILLVALVMSPPDGVTLVLAIAMGAAVALATWAREGSR
jgi:hypothetical protein